jgi:hypothetical protein
MGCTLHHFHPRSQASRCRTILERLRTVSMVQLLARAQNLWCLACDAAAGVLQVYYPVVTASSQLDPSLVANLTGPNTTVRLCP